jgi:hypothetical protein
MTGRGRAARALVFAVVSVALATGAHWFGCGLVPHPSVLIAALSATAVIGWFVAERRHGATLVGTTAAVQIAMHVGFAASMATGGMSSMSLILCRDRQSVGPTHAESLPMAVHGGSVLTNSHGIPMLAGHLAAAVLVGLWMHHGERLFSSVGALFGALAATVRRLARRLLGGCLSGPGEVHLSFSVATHARHLRDRTAGAVGLRGPPTPQTC